MNLQPTPRGVLDPRAVGAEFDLALEPPPGDLREVVEHFWHVRWDMRGRPPHEQHTLPHPSVHLVVESDPRRSGIFGIVRGRYTRLLEEKGWAFGVKFRPAGFRPFFDARLSTLTGHIVPVARVFGAEGDAFAWRIGSLADATAMVACSCEFLRYRQPVSDDTTALLNAIVAAVVADRSITRVAQLVEQFGRSERQLQRLFGEYVGVSPKWVIQRARLIEAAERLAAGDEVDSATLAQDLGYFDQAHFIRDFGSVVGRPPADYARGLRYRTPKRKQR